MDLFIIIHFFIFGLLIGSFLNVIILRLPEKKDLVYQRSQCPKCGAQLKWYHNIPLLSFIALRGKCGFCGTKISWQYPLVELVTAIAAVLLMPSYISMDSLLNFVFYFTIACIFICHFVIDLRHQLLLDSLNLYLLANFLIFSFFRLPYSFWLVGGLIGFLAPLAVTWIFYKIRGQVGLGGGDIKLFGILGIYLGPLGIFFNIFMSCFLGALIGILLIALKKTSKDRPIAFGPFILIVATFQIFFPEYSVAAQKFIFGLN